jgi:hypothetical protein
MTQPRVSLFIFAIMIAVSPKWPIRLRLQQLSVSQSAGLGAARESASCGSSKYGVYGWSNFVALGAEALCLYDYIYQRKDADVG